jgi:hypothetical protein
MVNVWAEATNPSSDIIPIPAHALGTNEVPLKHIAPPTENPAPFICAGAIVAPGLAGDEDSTVVIVTGEPLVGTFQ